MLHRNDDGTYAISGGYGWGPGIYEDARTARWAFRFDFALLDRLQTEANERAGGKGGVITRDDLVRAKAAEAKG